MVDFITQLIDNLIYGPVYLEGVYYAWLPAVLAGASVITGGLQYLSGRKKRKMMERRAKTLDQQREESMEGLDEQITDVLGRAEAVETDATAEDVYGESIQALTDRIQGGRATAGRQLGRSVMAGGGDITGSIQATLGKLTEQSNKSIIDVINEYNERVDRRNLQQRSRQDQLISRGLSARGNQLTALSGMAEQAYTRSAQKSTADKQLFMDTIGTGANLASIAQGGG